MKNEISFQFQTLVFLMKYYTVNWVLFPSKACPVQSMGSPRVRHDWATPWTVVYQAPLSMEFSRQGYWSGLPCSAPGDLPNPGIKPASLYVSCIGRRFFTSNATWEASWWRLNEIIRANIIGLVSCKKRKRHQSSLPIMWQHSKTTTLLSQEEQLLPGTGSLGTLIMGFQPPPSCEK